MDADHKETKEMSIQQFRRAKAIDTTDKRERNFY